MTFTLNASVNTYKREEENFKALSHLHLTRVLIIDIQMLKKVLIHEISYTYNSIRSHIHTFDKKNIKKRIPMFRKYID